MTATTKVKAGAAPIKGIITRRLGPTGVIRA
jgi:hypothetical protein